MFQSQGSLERRWRVGGEVKAERNALFLCVCLVCGNRPSSVPAECSHYALRGALAQRPLLCVTVSVCVSGCVRVHPSFNFNSRWHRELARSLAWAPWLTHLRRYRRSKRDVTMERRAREECQWDWKKGWNR